MGAETSLEFLLFSGNYDAIITRTSRSTDPATMPVLIGALALSGRLDEAQSAFRALGDEHADPDALTQARFYLIAGQCHAGNAAKALRLVRASLADLGHGGGRTQFWIWQGLALVRFFEGRFRRARAAGRRALASALLAAFPYARVLALDLLAHVLLQTGAVHAGLRLLTQAADLAESLGYTDNTATLRTSAVVYQLQFLLTDVASAIAQVQQAVATASVSYFTRRNGLIELASALALCGDSRGAQKALDDARRITLPGSDRRGRTRWLVARGLVTALSRGGAQARDVFDEARAEAGDQIALLAELGFVESLFVGVTDTLRATLPNIARTTGIARAEVAAALLTDSDLPSTVRIEDGLSRVVLSCWRCDAAERVAIVSSAGLLGLLPWALRLAPGRRLVLTATHLLTEDAGTVVRSPAPTGPSLRLLLALRHGFQSREELAHTVWGLARYNPTKHNAVINTAISRLRLALAEPSWVVTHEAGYHLAEGVELIALEQGGATVAAVDSAEPPPRPEETRLLDLLRRDGPSSSAEIARALKMSSSSALRLLRRMVDQSEIIRVGSGRATRYGLPDG